MQALVVGKDLESHLIQLIRHSSSGVVAVGQEAGLSMSGQIQHHQAPALGKVLGHDHPHGLVGTEPMHEEHCQGILGINRG